MFALAWRAVASDERMLALPPQPILIFEHPAHGDFMARIVGRRRSTIQISHTFARAVGREVGLEAPLILSAVLGARPVSTPARAAVIRAVHDLAILFVVHHELSHLVGGHVAWRAASSSAPRRAFDEVNLGLGDDDSAGATTSSREAREAYYLEVEADNSGLQWLMQSRPPASLGRLSGHGRVALVDSTGDARVLSFRMLMVAVWLVMRLTEARRNPRIVKPSASHPRPAARLLAAIATMMEHFALLTELRADASGQRIQTLGEQQAEDSRLFVTEVVRPVLRVDWSRPGAPLVSGSLSKTLPLVLRDLHNLLLIRKATTPGGIELEQLERLRRRMNRTLAPHRYATARTT